MNDESEIQTIRGTVSCVWDSRGGERHVLVHIEPDERHGLSTWDLHDDHHDAVIGKLAEGSRIEISYRFDGHEIVDPDSLTPIDSRRAHVESVRLLD